MRIVVRSLIVEVGRQCTMSCPHCLRGPQEVLENTFDNVKRLIDQLASIDTIVFTGGEPFLYQELIIAVIDYIMQNRIVCEGFYIATNGTIMSYTLMNKLCKFYQYCNAFGYETGVFSDNYSSFSLLEISIDKYHDKLSEKNLSFFNMYRFCQLREDDYNRENLINQGNTYLNKLSCRNPNFEPTSFYYEHINDELMIEEVYLNSDGYILPDCDLSYETQRSWTILVNVDNNVQSCESLYTALQLWNKKVEEL